MNRKNIRAAAVAILKNSNTAAGQNVFSNRIRPFNPEELPAINILTKEENITLNNVAPRIYERELELVIVCAEKAKNSIDDDLDDLSQEIETSLLKSGSNYMFLNEQAEDLRLSNFQSNYELGDQQIGACALTFIASYKTEINDIPSEELEIVEGDIKTQPDLDQENYPLKINF